MPPPFSTLLSFLIILALALPFSLAHFVIVSPKSIGFVDTDEGIGPCGGIPISTRTPLTTWPVAGYPVAIISTHPNAVWQFRAALLNSTDTFVYATPPLYQASLGVFCFTIPGPKEWIGLDGVVQIIQNAVDGSLFQVRSHLPRYPHLGIHTYY